MYQGGYTDAIQMEPYAGAPDYDCETGFGFVTGAVYNADAALHIPETNSGFLPLWWYAGTPISDIRQSEYGLQATAAEALRI